MIHSDYLHNIKRDPESNFVYPAYGKQSLSEIAPSIEKLYGVDTKENCFEFKISDSAPKYLIFIIVDGFSFNHFVKYSFDFPFLRKLGDKAEVYPLTSVFPSTTPAALTTISTGLSPQEHGLPEWTVYFEEFDSIIETLPFKTWEMQEQDGLLKIGGVAEMLYEGETLFENLKKAGVKSFTFTSHKYSHSAYNQVVQKGSHFIPYLTKELIFPTVSEFISAVTPNSLFYIYYPYIDTAGHSFGPGSPEYIKEIEFFYSNMEEQLIKKIPKEIARDTLLIMTSDHGLSSIKGDDIINLNKYSFLEQNFKKGKNGNKILPTGSPHDVLLFIEPNVKDKILEYLRGELHEKAEVITTEEAVKRGLFGENTPNEKFIRRIGNILILPYPGYHVWYQFIPNASYHMLGMHGGLSEEEMLVPFLFTNVSNLTE